METMINKSSKRKNNKTNSIPKLRKKHNLSQQELADILEISRPHLSNIENGKVMPGGNIVTKLCMLFDVTPEEIFFNQYVHYGKQTTA